MPSAAGKGTKTSPPVRVGWLFLGAGKEKAAGAERALAGEKRVWPGILRSKMGAGCGLKAENAAVEMFPVPFWSPPGGGNGVEKRRNAASGVPGGGFGAAKNRVWAGILRASDGENRAPDGEIPGKSKKERKTICGIPDPGYKEGSHETMRSAVG